jgi:hypothetical protein
LIVPAVDLSSLNDPARPPNKTAEEPGLFQTKHGVEKWKKQLANELSVVVDRKRSLGLLDRTLATIVVEHMCPAAAVTYLWG